MAVTSRSPISSPALDSLQRRTGLDIPVHVDGASGAMVAPFLDPYLRWDFHSSPGWHRSTHQTQVRPRLSGVGWVLWRDKASLPAELVYEVNYLAATCRRLR